MPELITSLEQIIDWNDENGASQSTDVGRLGPIVHETVVALRSLPAFPPRTRQPDPYLTRLRRLVDRRAEQR